MLTVVPRGIVYHKLSDDIYSLAASLFARLNEDFYINEFENQFSQYIGCKHSLAFPFARTAIYYALKAKDFPPGSEILMPPITIKPILDIVLELKLKPVFVDIDPNTLCFDLDQLKKSNNSNTKAALFTYLFGMVPKLDDMTSYCKENDIFMIEDFSQCLNGKFDGKKVGGFGDVGIYSSSSIKTLDTYGGGLLVCNDDELYKQLHDSQSKLKPPSRIQLIRKIITNLIRNLATQRIIFHTLVFPLLRLASFFNPNSVQKHTGDRDKKMIKSLPDEWFTSYTSFQAKFGLKMLAKVEKEDKKRVSNVEYLKNNALNVNYPKGIKGADNVYWQFVAYFSSPKETLAYFHSKKIDTSTTSLAKISTLPSYPCQGITPNADKLYNNGFFIPAYPGLHQKDLKHIAQSLNDITSSNLNL